MYDKKLLMIEDLHNKFNNTNLTSLVIDSRFNKTNLELIINYSFTITGLKKLLH